MKKFSLQPEIVMMDTVKEFCEVYKIGAGDLLFVSNGTYSRYFDGLTRGAQVVNYRKYGSGEPTDLMVEGIYKDIDKNYKRVIAVGGGTILDVAKLFALKVTSPVVELYEGKIPAEKEKELILVPTTCGTGSEVTNISILELTTIHTKKGLAQEALFADEAVLIPELLKELPFRFFATSSIDAFIHSVESYLSPKASAFSRMYSRQAMKLILEAYQVIAKDGEEARKPLLGDLLLASTYAGIAFGNAGCAAVHAMSYPLGAARHVPHGEANYTMFAGVFKTYMSIDPNGAIKELNEYLAEILSCSTESVYEELEKLMNHLIPLKALHEYGVAKEDLEEYTDIVMTQQGRLMANNYVELDRKTVMSIYKKLY